MTLHIINVFPPDVYLAVNGRVLDPRRARKNAARHAFEEVPAER